ncbi:MAG TPA: hypothetical protein VFF65_11185 [Phycisphaerales bacterium]|nr:hypothetical protein [Phycisphaerales bacterium]
MHPRTHQSRARLLRLASVVAAAAIVWLAVLIGIVALIPIPEPQPTWTAAGGTPVPDEFIVVMYPANGSVPLCDAPGGRVIGTLSRALANSHRELATGGTGGWIHVNGRPGGSWVRLADLAFHPPANSTTDYFAAYAALYAKRSPRGFASASMSSNPNPDGSQTMTLTRRPDDDHVEKYLYRVAGGVPQPLEMHAYFGPATVLGPRLYVLAGAFVAASLAATATIVAGLHIVSRLERPSQSPPGHREDPGLHHSGDQTDH